MTKIPDAGPPGTDVETSWGQAVADALNDVLVQRGTVQIPGDGSSWTSNAPVTFPVPFGATPTVVACVAAGSTGWAGNLENVARHTAGSAAATTTGFTAALAATDGATNIAAPVAVAWIAVGPRA